MWLTKLACLDKQGFWVWGYPPKSDGNLFEVLECKRYHLGVLDKPPNFQGDRENLLHFMMIFVQVPFRAIEARQTCSPLPIGVCEFLKFITRHSKPYLADSIRKPPLQNLLTRVCKSLGTSHTKMTIMRSPCVELQNFKMILSCWFHVLYESTWPLWCIRSRFQLPPGLLLGPKMWQMAIFLPFWSLGDVTPRYHLQNKLKSSESHSFYLVMMKDSNLNTLKEACDRVALPCVSLSGKNQCNAQCTRLIIVH